MGSFSQTSCQLINAADVQPVNHSPGQQRVRQLNVLNRGFLGVPLRLDGVGGGQHRGPCVQLANNPGLQGEQKQRENFPPAG